MHVQCSRTQLQTKIDRTTPTQWQLTHHSLVNGCAWKSINLTSPHSDSHNQLLNACTDIKISSHTVCTVKYTCTVYSQFVDQEHSNTCNSSSTHNCTKHIEQLQYERTWMSGFQVETASSVSILMKEVVSPSLKNLWHGSLFTSRPVKETCPFLKIIRISSYKRLPRINTGPVYTPAVQGAV